jgi:diguanylate cyclase (GGDEF)-like protein
MFDQDLPILPEQHFNFVLKQECERAERYSHFFSIAMVKLSELEDPLLTTTAKIIRGAVRDSDIMGALQDKHLAVILHHADAQNTDEIAMRIRGNIRELAESLSQTPKNRQIRVGAACFPTHAPTFQDLLKAVQERFSEPDTDPK